MDKTLLEMCLLVVIACVLVTTCSYTDSKSYCMRACLDGTNQYKHCAELCK